MQKLQDKKQENFNYQAAIEAAAEGRTLKEISSALGVSYRRMCSIMNMDASFSEAIKKAREVGFYLKAEELSTMVEDNPLEDTQRLRLKSENLRWLLSKMLPSVFGDRLEVKVERVDVGAALLEARARVLRSGRDLADFNSAHQIENAEVSDEVPTDSESVSGALDRILPPGSNRASESSSEQPLNPDTMEAERSEAPSNPTPLPLPTGLEGEMTIMPSRMLVTSPFD